MPVYEYSCQACGHEFEREQRITEDPIKTCPECRAARAKRMISRTSFVLKGGGWYSDLYATPGAEAKKSEADSAKGDDAAAKTDTGAKEAPSEKANRKPDKKKKAGSKGDGKSGAKSSKGAKGSAAA